MENIQIAIRNNIQDSNIEKCGGTNHAGLNVYSGETFLFRSGVTMRCCVFDRL